MTNPTTYLAVDPDGSFRDVPASYEGIKSGLNEATLDLVRLPDGQHALFIDDEGMLNGARLNVPASLFAERALYGPVVLVGPTDEEGDSTPPTAQAHAAFRVLATMWAAAEADATAKGQRVEIVATAETIPPPEIFGLDEGDFERWCSGDLGIDELRARGTS